MILKIKQALILIANVILQLLPGSPFQSFLDSFADIPALGYLNYFVPISEMIAIGQAWLLCVGGFYLYSAIMRFVKLIE